jgi:hypothetical protein
MATKFTPFNLSRIDKMKFQIRIWTAAGLVTYITALVYLTSPEFFFANLSLVRVIAWVAAATFAMYFSIGNFHNWFDKRFFHERAKVDSQIRYDLTSPCRTNCDRGKLGIFPSEEGQLMDMFYTFITADDTERERAFSYFTEYFVTVNLSVFSILGSFLTAVIYLLLPFQSTGQFVVGVIVLVLFPLIANLMRLRVRRKLRLPGAAQTKRILAESSAKLATMLPNYRFYQNSTTCRDSGKCPLIAEPNRT